jgi:hypothetical protein
MVWVVLVSVAGLSNAEDRTVEATDELQDCMYTAYKNILKHKSIDFYLKKQTINT